jgi:hypothetical protein
MLVRNAKSAPKGRDDATRRCCTPGVAPLVGRGIESMVDCECLARCPFFHDNLPNMPASATLTKKRLCQDDFSKCARYMVFRAMGRQGVPRDLYPDDLDRAERILADE